jgi:hypothetical protein
MAEEIEITIADLGDAAPEFGIEETDLKLIADDKKTVLVKVYVDGKDVKPEKKTDESITIEPPPSADGGTSTIVVTTNDGKILNVLNYEGNKKIPVEDPADDETTLKDIAKAIKKIAEAMAPPTPSASPTPSGAATLPAAPASGAATPRGASSTPITSDKPSKTR